MAFRPYPNAARARTQLNRHAHPASLVVTMRPETALLMHNLMRASRYLAAPAMENARAALRALPAASAFLPATRPASALTMEG